MKQRIISLILVLALSLLALVGCGYDYAKDDMSKYTELNSSAFLAALKALKIKDGDFGTDEAQRLIKVADNIYTSLATIVKNEYKDADAAKKEELKQVLGTPDRYDVCYYNYYVTYVKDGKTVKLALTNMTESSAKTLQLGLSSLKDLNKKIADCLAAMNLADGAVYSTTTGSTTDLGSAVIVSYKLTKENGTDIPTASQTTKTDFFYIGAKPATYDDKLADLELELKKSTAEYDEAKAAYDAAGDTKPEAVTNRYNEALAAKNAASAAVDAKNAALKSWTFEDHLYGASVGSSLGTVQIYDGDTVKNKYENVTVKSVAALPGSIASISYKLSYVEKDGSGKATITQNITNELVTVPTVKRDQFDKTLDELKKAYTTAKTEFDTAKAAYDAATGTKPQDVVDAYNAAETKLNAADAALKAKQQWAFEDYLYLAAINQSLGKITVYKDGDGDGNIVTETTGNATNFDEFEYTDVKINYIVKSGMNEHYESAFKVTDKTYTKDTDVLTDMYGGEHKVGNVELTYHIFPVYYLKVDDAYTAKTVLKDIIGSSIFAAVDKNEDGKISEYDDDSTVPEDERDSKGYLDIFSDFGYKRGDKTLNTLIKELADIYAEISELETKLKDVQKDFDDAEKSYNAALTAGTKLEDVKKVYDAQKANLSTAKKNLEEKEAKRDGKINEILGVTKEGDTVTFADAIIASYKDKVYDNLETTYKNEIKKNLATEIYALLKENTKFSKDDRGWWILPRAAVDAAYSDILNDYELKYYEGKYSDDSTKTNFEYYQNNGGFNRYLINALKLDKEATEQDIRDAIGKKADESVMEKVRVYALASLLASNDADADVLVTREDIDEFKKSYYYAYLTLVYKVEPEEADFTPMLQLDKALDYLLEEKDGEDATNPNKVVYERLEYTFITDEESED